MGQTTIDAIIKAGAGEPDAKTWRKCAVVVKKCSKLRCKLLDVFGDVKCKTPFFFHMQDIATVEVQDSWSARPLVSYNVLHNMK